MGTCLGAPQRVLFECFLAFFRPKKGRKSTPKRYSLGHSEGGAQNCSRSTPWGTFRPGPRSTPVNGGRVRNHRQPFTWYLCLCLFLLLVVSSLQWRLRMPKGSFHISCRCQMMEAFLVPRFVAEPPVNFRYLPGSSERGRCRRGRSEIPHFPSKLQSFALVPGE